MPAAFEMLWFIRELCGQHGVSIQGPWTLLSGLAGWALRIYLVGHHCIKNGKVMLEKEKGLARGHTAS